MSINNDQDDREARIAPKAKAYDGFYVRSKDIPATVPNTDTTPTRRRMNKLAIDLPACTPTQTYMLSLTEAYNRVLESNDESGIRDSTLDKLCGLAEHTGWLAEVDCDDIARYINSASCETYRYRQHMWLESQFGNSDSMYLAETDHDDMLDSLANDSQERKGRPNECYTELLAQDVKSELLGLLYNIGEYARIKLIQSTSKYARQDKPCQNARLQRSIAKYSDSIPTCKAIAEDMKNYSVACP